MAFEHYIRKGRKKLRFGYTTGTCAALAAAAATRMLLTGEPVDSISLMTPKGIEVDADVEKWGLDGADGSVPDVKPERAWAGVCKDAGDDSDVTDGMLICARVERTAQPGEDHLTDDERFRIDGGEGVGRVTKPGLDQPVGNAAINSGPRKMIEEEVSKVCEELSYDGGLSITVFVPEGEKAAGQTFNGNLGIEGGISILGTSGIVEPMSEQALLDTIELEMKQDGLQTDRLIMTPGNYGVHYISEKGLDRLEDERGVGIPVLKFSNFLGDTLDMLPDSGIREVLLVAHGGKLVKVAAGVMNTHSSWADCRREVICSHTACCGGDAELCRCIMDAATTDACFDLLDDAGLLDDVIGSVLGEIQNHLDLRVGGAVRIGALMFSNERGTLGASPEAVRILAEWNEEEKGVSL